MSKLNIGMIGAGFIGQLAHFSNFTTLANANVIAVAEFKPELRRKVAARYDIPKTYASHQELIKDPEIDAVVVVTARPFTGPIVLDCLNAGKHVFSEKPMVGCTTQAKKLLDAANNAKVRYAVGYMKRYDAGVQVAKKVLDEVLQDNALGKVLAVNATCYMGNSYCNPYGHIMTDEKPDDSMAGWGIGPSWLAEKHHPFYGAYLNTFSHVTNLLRYFFEETPKIEYTSLLQHPGHLAVLGFKSFVATLQTGKMSHNDWSEEIRITFTDGEVYIKMPPALLRNVPASVEIYRAGKVQEVKKPAIDWSWAFHHQAQAFVDSVLEGKPMLIEAEEAYRELLLIESIWQAEINRIETQVQGKTAA